MLDSLGGKQTSSWLDSLSSTANNSSFVSFGSPNPSHTNNSETPSRPSWLFGSQPVHDSLSSPTEALSSLLDTFSSPVSDTCSSFSIGQLSGSPYKQMTSPNRFAQSNRRAFGITSHYESNNSPGAPGTPINSSAVASVNFNPHGGVTTLSNVPPPKNPKLYKTELCRSWMDHGRCNYGERCQYAHGEQEKRPIPRHPKYKTEACQSYHQSGYCPYGPRCHFIHSEADLLANLPTPPSSVRNSHNSFLPQTCTQQLSSATFTGAALTNQVINTQENILLGGSVLQRVSSLPGYGSTGESTAGSSSSADSGSESPNGSFSPALDIDDGGSFGTSFMLTHPVSKRAQQISNSVNYDLNRTRNDSTVHGLIVDTMSLTLDDKWERTPDRLPVFAQLSNAQ